MIIRFIILVPLALGSLFALTVDDTFHRTGQIRLIEHNLRSDFGLDFSSYWVGLVLRLLIVLFIILLPFATGRECATIVDHVFHHYWSPVALSRECAPTLIILFIMLVPQPLLGPMCPDV
jgi:hypothetical protein